jgi:hypothetical protein
MVKSGGAVVGVITPSLRACDPNHTRRAGSFALQPVANVVILPRRGCRAASAISADGARRHVRAHSIRHGPSRADAVMVRLWPDGAKTFERGRPDGIEAGKPANFLVLDADTPFEALRQRLDP